MLSALLRIKVLNSSRDVFNIVYRDVISSMVSIDVENYSLKQFVVDIVIVAYTLVRYFVHVTRFNCV